MNEWFDKETGLLNLDEVILKNKSYQKIMEDGIVTSEELREQGEKTVQLLKDVEKMLNEQEKEKVGLLLSELSVLFSLHNYKQLTDLSKGEI